MTELTNEKIEAAIEAWFDTDGKDVDDHQSRMRAAILAANKEPADPPLLVCSETLREAILRGDKFACGIALGLAYLAKEQQ